MQNLIICGDFSFNICIKNCYYVAEIYLIEVAYGDSILRDFMNVMPSCQVGN